MTTDTSVHPDQSDVPATAPGRGADLDHTRGIAGQLRVDAIRASTAAGSGHPTSSLSAADLAAVLLDRHLTYDWAHPDRPDNDHFVLSKGHASPLLYAMFRAAGVIDEDELLSGYRQLHSRLQGHPTPVLPWVDVATGSLGQGLPVGVGIALAGKHLERLPYRVWVLCGDSEMAEGSIWEALDHASHYELDNLIALIDVNRLGQRGPTELGWDVDRYAQRARAFGCRAITVDGHDLEAIDAAMVSASQGDGRPTVIVARTIKGKGVPEIEDADGWHGKPLPADMAARAVAALGGTSDLRSDGPTPGVASIPAPNAAPVTVELPRFAVADEVATRQAYGQALAALAVRPDLVVVDAEVSNSTYADAFAKVAPERYFEMYIAEQQLVAAALGLSVRGYTVFASTFAAFLSRAHDFVRMDGISQVDLRLVGSHCGVEIGPDGPSQMALEDLAWTRAIQDSVVLYPADATATAALAQIMADTPGISYLRTTRGAYPVLYPTDETFAVGGSKVHHGGPDDEVTLIGAGVTLHECLKARAVLAAEGVTARVIDLYSVKPVDLATIEASCRVTGGRVVIVEDHHPEGGLASAVLEALAAAGEVNLRVHHLAVRTLPGSGSPQELLDRAGLTARHIAAAARELIAGLSPVATS